MIINDHCPHCEQPCVSNLRKLFLVPGARTPCRSCGAPVAVPLYGLVSIFPLMFAFMIFSAPEGGMALRVAVAAVMVGMAVYYQVFLLPLVAR